MAKHLEMEISTRRLGDDAAVIHIGGEVDLYTTPQVREEIVALIEGGVRRMVIDLSDTEYLDSTALGALVGAVKRLAEREGDLRLVNPQPRIRKLLEITRLAKVFNVCDSVAQALEGWQGEAAR